MKKIMTTMLFLVTAIISAQDKAVVAWLNANAIAVEDAAQTTPLTAFAANTPQKFTDARVFGFGEATHHTKEFFDLKAKFFKYLVVKQGVNIFIMEDSYIECYKVNQWLAGKTEGTARKMAGSLGFSLWRTQEVANLLQWIKDYNTGKPEGRQIRFYGMDDQSGEGINTLVRNYAKEQQIEIPETLLAVADACSNKRMIPAPAKEWSAENVAKLKELRDVISGKNTTDTATNEQMLHAIDVLIQYTNFIAKPNMELRDNDMFDNVKWIVEHEGENSKAFVWAHNDHINKKTLGYWGNTSIGRRLKDFYKDAYYSTGFDFGKGRLYGLTYTGKERKPQATTYNLEKPYGGTYAEVLIQVQPEIFFVDMATAEKDPVAAKFFSSNKKQLSAGGGGYHPKDRSTSKRNYTESYDGLIFVENVSVPVYIKEAVPAVYYVE
ncbi:MAG: erythromycin esterase family protein [Bacteroidia bacterium]